MLTFGMQDAPRLTNSAGLRTMLELESPTTIMEALDALGVQVIDKSAVLRGMPGQQLTEMDLSRVKLEPLRVFAKDEIVAISPTDTPANDAKSSLVYARVLAHDKDTIGALSRVVVAAPSHPHTTKPNPHPRQHAISHRTLLSSEIYSFQSHLDSKGALSSRSSGGGGGGGSRGRGRGTPARPLREPLDAKLGPGAQARSLARRGGDAKEKRKGQGGGSRSASENEDLISAVSSLLARVNLPVTLEQKQLMKTNMGLQDELRAMKKQITLVCDAKDRANQRLKKIADGFTCKICLSEPIDRILIPCGHFVCSSCEGLLRTRSCPFCRQRYQTSTKFYLPFDEGEVS
mmetsp:Transcript_22436/g.43639  ORF Transcript_22436/g.43639 Transcript_22436/m.43639 type:complete len:346 (+) Transcript_22436:61-1098(+)